MSAGFLACRLFPFPVILFQWVVLKRPVDNSIDFTAAGTAPVFHRIPFPKWGCH